MSLESRIPPLLSGDQNVLRIVELDKLKSPVLIPTPYEFPCAYHTAFIMTNYQILCVPHDEAKYPIVHIPLLMIESYQDIGSQAHRDYYAIEIQTKHLWAWRIGFRNPQEQRGVLKCLEALKVTRIKDMFAFTYLKGVKKVNPTHVDYGWSLYDVKAELERQTLKAGMSGDSFSESTPAPTTPIKYGVKENLRPFFKIVSLSASDSPTYPRQVVVPVGCTDEVIKKVVQFRSRGRFPVISYVHLESGGVIARCAQPLVGQVTKAFIGNRRCIEDETLCAQLIQAYNPNGPASQQQQASQQGGSLQSPKAATTTASFMPPPSLFMGGGGPLRPAQPPPSNLVNDQRRVLNIVDCRSKAAANANRAKGGGYEDPDNYERSKVHFFNMENIHAVTASWKKLRGVVQSGGNQNFYSAWEASGWMLHIQAILYATVKVTEMLQNGECALIHCSDGWDRTAMLTSLSMLFLDPYYRTLRGFMILVEKEWCSMGHKFAERLNHQVAGESQMAAEGAGNDIEENSSSTAQHGGLQPSPVFMQFIDSVYQLLRQSPGAFEFTPRFLMDLSESAFSGRYGTFLCNFERERVAERVTLDTMSLWTDVDMIVREERRTKKPRYLNPYYSPESSSSVLTGITVTFKRLVFWEQMYLRYETDSLGLEFIADIGRAPAFVEPNRIAPQQKAIVSPTTTPLEGGGAAEAPPEPENNDDDGESSDEEVSLAMERRKAAIEGSVTTSAQQQQQQHPHKRRINKDVKGCSMCTAQFSWRVRKHVCLHCGGAFCSSCSVDLGTFSRICKSCHAMIATK